MFYILLVIYFNINITEGGLLIFFHKLCIDYIINIIIINIYF